MQILITIPYTIGKGGVSSYYNSILPFMKDSIEDNIIKLEIGGIKRSKKLFHPITDQIRFYRQISRKQFDLIHVNPSLDIKSILRDGMFLYQAKKKNWPTIVFFHGWKTNNEKLIESKYINLIKKNILSADCYIVLSSHFKKKLIEWGVKVPIHIETTAIDEKLLKNFKIENKIKNIKNSTSTKILFLARIEKKKGIYETIEAIKILLERGNNIEFTIAGDGNELKKIRKYIKEDKVLNNKVDILGYVRGIKKTKVFSLNHIYCLPTYSEGMPTSILEAMAFGMPVVTTPVGGLIDFFKDSEMGCFIKKNEPYTIADQIEEIMFNKDKIIDTAIYNHKYATKRFLASKVSKRVKEIYKNTIIAQCCSK